MGVAMSRKVLIVAGAFIVLEVALGGLAWLDRYDIDDRIVQRPPKQSRIPRPKPSSSKRSKIKI
jgi:hypothetical protein